MSDRVATPTLITTADVTTANDGEQELQQLLAGRADSAEAATNRIDGVLVGTLIGFTNDGATPLVAYRGQPVSMALPARATLDLHASHIGRQAVVMFEEGDPYRPIIIGCLHGSDERSVPDLPGRVEVDADGQRLMVSAKEQIVLRCGKASITLTRAGKVIVQGTYVSSRSSGVIRIKGGSVQIN